MKFHHICLVVSDMEKSLALYRDVLGFSVHIDTVIPGGEGSRQFFTQATLDDIFKIKGAKSRMVMLSSTEGALIELQQPAVPMVRAVDRKYLRYGYVGISELAFDVSGIETWFEKIHAAGYEMQTDYVWSVQGGRLNSFIFYDDDGSMIQLCERVRVNTSTPSPVLSSPGVA